MPAIKSATQPTPAAVDLARLMDLLRQALEVGERLQDEHPGELDRVLPDFAAEIFAREQLPFLMTAVHYFESFVSCHTSSHDYPAARAAAGISR